MVPSSRADRLLKSSFTLTLILSLCFFMAGCSITRKTTIETGGDQEVQRTSYSFEFHGLLGDDSDDD